MADRQRRRRLRPDIGEGGAAVTTEPLAGGTRAAAVWTRRAGDHSPSPSSHHASGEHRYSTTEVRKCRVVRHKKKLANVSDGSDPARAVAEMKRVLRPGGTAAVYVWDHAGEMELIQHFWNAAIALDPA